MIFSRAEYSLSNEGGHELYEPNFGESLRILQDVKLTEHSKSILLRLLPEINGRVLRRVGSVEIVRLAAKQPDMSAELIKLLNSIRHLTGELEDEKNKTIAKLSIPKRFIGDLERLEGKWNVKTVLQQADVNNQPRPPKGGEANSFKFESLRLINCYANQNRYIYEFVFSEGELGFSRNTYQRNSKTGSEKEPLTIQLPPGSPMTKPFPGYQRINHLSPVKIEFKGNDHVLLKFSESNTKKGFSNSHWELVRDKSREN